MAETSVQQMALTRNTEFMERVTAMLARVSGVVLVESGGTPYHQPRAFYAQRVVSGPSQAAAQGGPIVVMGVNVVNATTYDEINKVAECTIADIDLESQITSLWNTLAGIDTPS